jgi:hypothetical protein
MLIFSHGYTRIYYGYTRIKCLSVFIRSSIRVNPCKIVLLLLIIFAVVANVCYCEEQFKYDPRGKRDPMVPLIGKDKPMILKLENITSVEDVRLEGIADGPKGRVAVLNGELVRVDDRFGEVVIKDITKRAVTVIIEGKEYTINLPEEGGFKSDK